MHWLTFNCSSTTTASQDFFSISKPSGLLAGPGTPLALKSSATMYRCLTSWKSLGHFRRCPFHAPSGYCGCFGHLQFPMVNGVGSSMVSPTTYPNTPRTCSAHCDLCLTC